MDLHKSDLDEFFDCTPEHIAPLIVLQIKTFGPQNLDQFLSELWEFCPQHIQAALDLLVNSGILSQQAWICGDIYRTNAGILEH